MVSPFLRSLFQPKVLLVISLHWTSAIALVFVNKQLVSSRHGGHDLIVFIAWSQCLFTVIAVLVFSVLRWWWKSEASLFNMPLVTLIHRDVLAMSFSFIGTIVMNNLLLKHIGVAFYQIARSSTLIFTVVFSWILLHVHVSQQVVLSCFLVILGFIISADQEILLSSLSLAGIAYGILASVSAALCGIFIKRANRLVQGDSLRIAFVNNVNSVVLLFPLLVSTGELQFTMSMDHEIDVFVWMKMAMTGALSLLMGWASVAVIGLTSPLTHVMSTNAKSLLQTVIAVFAHRELKTTSWWLGNFLVIIGIINYSFSRTLKSDVKDVEMIGNQSQCHHGGHALEKTSNSKLPL